MDTIKDSVVDFYQQMLINIDSFIVSAQERGDIMRVSYLREMRKKAEEVLKNRK